MTAPITVPARSGSTRAARPAALLRSARRRVVLPLAGVAAIAAVATTVALTPV